MNRHFLTRTALKSLFTLALAIMLQNSVMAADLHFYIGTYTRNENPVSKGIYRWDLNGETGQLGPVMLATESRNPSFLAFSPDKKYLYAINENAEGSIESFRVESNGRLTLLKALPTEGGPAHVSVDKTGQYVFVASYGKGNVSCFKADDGGALVSRTSLIQFNGSGPNSARQKQSHAHAIYPDPEGKFAYVCDLGADTIWMLKLDRGTMAPVDSAPIRVPEGGGPRHLVFSPDGKYVHVANEMGLSVTSFSRDAATGALKRLDTVSLFDEGKSDPAWTVAEIALHPSGKWLYVSCRGSNTLTRFSVGAEGKLTRAESVATPEQPRSFDIDPSGKWLVVAGQADNKVAVLKIDPASGTLSPASEAVAFGAPVCILFQ